MSPPSRLWVLVAIAVGGALGTAARYELARIEPVGAGTFPTATFVANVVGSLVLGVALVAIADGLPRSDVARAFVGVGFCGGLTTFSTWMVESVLLVRDGEAGTAVGYLLLSLVAGLVAVAAGVLLARRVLHRDAPFAFDPERDD